MHEVRDVQPPRRASQWEQEILRTLLLDEFPGRELLLAQVDRVRVVGECGDGCLSVLLSIEGDVEPAPAEERVPVEGRSSDADGMPIMLLLHVVDGFLHELEVLRADSGQIVRRPNATEIRILG